MPIFRKNHVILFALIASIYGCKTTHNQGMAQFKHSFGQTTAGRSTPPEKCEEGTDNETQRLYIRAITDHIIKNNPNSFRGYLDPKFICVKVANINAFNANMNPLNGMITVFKGLLDPKFQFNTDADVAAILSHELAHFTMGHGINNAVRTDNIPPGYDVSRELELRKIADEAGSNREHFLAKKSRDFFSLHAQELHSLVAEVNANMARNTPVSGLKKGVLEFEQAMNQTISSQEDLPAQEAMAGFDTYIIGIKNYAAGNFPDLMSPETLEKTTQLIVSREAVDSGLDPYDQAIAQAWDTLKEYTLPREQFNEQQADEVGFELFLRAGFDADVYPNTFEKIYQYVVGKTNCAAITSESPAPGRLRTDKDDRIHPDFCFRYWDLKYAEQRTHQKEYEPLIRRPGILYLPATEALRVKLAR